MRYYIAKWKSSIDVNVYLCNQSSFIITSTSKEKIVEEIDIELAKFICDLRGKKLPNEHFYAITL